VIAIYNTVMFFVERLRQITQVVMSFIDSMAAIASGNIGAAANRVEQTMAGLLTLVISFLARLVGLGRVSDAVINVVNRIRAPIDRALDRVVDWIVTQARRLGRAVAQAGVPQDPNERLRLAARAAVTAARRLSGRVTRSLLTPVLAAIRTRYGLTSLEAYEQGGRWWARARINPELSQDLQVSSSTSAETVTPEEAERQRRAQEETRTAIHRLLAAGVAKPRLMSAVTELRTRHRWRTLTLDALSTGGFRIQGGFSPQITLLDTEGVLSVVQVENVNVPQSIRGNWQGYENWVRNQLVRGTSGSANLSDLIRTGSGITTATQMMPVNELGRSSMPARVTLPTGTVQYFREPILANRTRPDAVILAPGQVVYVEITLKADWMMLEPTSGREGRLIQRLNGQRVHKISQIPGHILQLGLQFPSALRFTAIIFSDAAPSPASRARIREWLATELGGLSNLNVIWTIV